MQISSLLTESQAKTYMIRKHVIGLACDDFTRKDYFIYPGARHSEVVVLEYDYDSPHPVGRIEPRDKWKFVLLHYPETIPLDNRKHLPQGERHRKRGA